MKLPPDPFSGPAGEPSEGGQHAGHGGVGPAAFGCHRRADQDLFGQVVQGERRDCGLIVGGRTALGLADGQGLYPCPGGSSLACGTLAISPSPVFTKEARPMDYQSLRSAVTETCVGVRSCVELEPLGGPATSCSRPLTRWTTAPRPSTRSKTGASTARTSSASCWTRSPHKPTDENWRCSRPAGAVSSAFLWSRSISGARRWRTSTGSPPWRHRTASLMPCYATASSTACCSASAVSDKP